VQGLPRNLGDLVASAAINGGGIAKRNQVSGKGEEKSQQHVVPKKQGQPTKRPCGGKELPGYGTVRRNDGRDTDP